MDLVYKNEKTLFGIMLTLSVLVWLLLLVGTLGMALLYLLLVFVMYCFAQSAVISYIKGTGVHITEQQFPDLKRRISACCEKLGQHQEPEAYLMHMNGAFNAFATRFLGRDFIVLYSDIVDALHDNPDSLNFYIGHEIGHIKRKHLRWATVLLPASVLPLLGAAYSRAREYTCDRHGLAACDNPASAQFGLAALAAGGRRWRTMSKTNYVAQAEQSSGFWMSFHELTADYPWLVKRMGAVKALGNGHEPSPPTRSTGALLLALFVPRLGLGGGGGLIMLVAIIGMLAAVALPAYQQYTQKAQVAAAFDIGRQATTAVGRYYQANKALPTNIEQLGLSSRAPGGASVQIDGKSGDVLIGVQLAQGAAKTLSFSPSQEGDSALAWRCRSLDIADNLLPAACH